MDRALHRYNNDPRYVRAVRAYAGLMAADERAYLAFHAWEVYFRTTSGRVHLPVGYDEPRRSGPTSTSRGRGRRR